MQIAVMLDLNYKETISEETAPTVNIKNIQFALLRINSIFLQTFYFIASLFQR